jgi:polar amino acid transport system permease protein
VPAGQKEAAASLGLTRWQVFRLVGAAAGRSGPYCRRSATISCDDQDSALVSALGVQDITQLGKVYSASTFFSSRPTTWSRSFIWR